MSIPNACDTVAERVATGEPLDELAAHARTCPRCSAIAALPAELAATHHEIDPGLGFASRMTAGAQHRLGVRRRNRIIGSAALATVASAFAVFVMTRTPDDVAPDRPATEAKQDVPKPDPSEIAADTRMLIHLADTDRSSHLSAQWSHIAKPLHPYRAVLKGLSGVKGTTP